MKQLFIGIIIGTLGLHLAFVSVVTVAYFLIGNGYVTDVAVYFTAPIIAGVLSRHYFKTGKRSLAIGVLVGFGLYYPIWLVSLLWGFGEGGCDPYFFKLVDPC